MNNNNINNNINNNGNNNDLIVTAQEIESKKLSHKLKLSKKKIITVIVVIIVILEILNWLFPLFLISSSTSSSSQKNVFSCVSGNRRITINYTSERVYSYSKFNMDFEFPPVETTVDEYLVILEQQFKNKVGGTCTINGQPYESNTNDEIIIELYE